MHLKGGDDVTKLFDVLFGNKKPAITVPWILAAAIYLLFVVSGGAKNDLKMLWLTPFVTAVWFLGVYGVLRFQIKHTLPPAWMTNAFELLVILVFCGFSVVEAVLFVTEGFREFNIGICPGMVTYSAVAWAHSKR